MNVVLWSSRTTVEVSAPRKRNLLANDPDPGRATGQFARKPQLLKGKYFRELTQRRCAIVTFDFQDCQRICRCGTDQSQRGARDRRLRRSRRHHFESPRRHRASPSQSHASETHAKLPGQRPAVAAGINALPAACVRYWPSALGRNGFVSGKAMIHPPSECSAGWG